MFLWQNVLRLRTGIFSSQIRWEKEGRFWLGFPCVMHSVLRYACSLSVASGSELRTEGCSFLFVLSLILFPMIPTFVSLNVFVLCLKMRLLAVLAWAVALLWDLVRTNAVILVRPSDNVEIPRFCQQDVKKDYHHFWILRNSDLSFLGEQVVKSSTSLRNGAWSTFLRH